MQNLWAQMRRFQMRNQKNSPKLAKIREKYLNPIINNTSRWKNQVVKPLKKIKPFFVLLNEKGAIKPVLLKVLDITFDGLIMWVCFFPFAYFFVFWKLVNPLLIFPYGLLVYFILEFRHNWIQK